MKKLLPLFFLTPLAFAGLLPSMPTEKESIIIYAEILEAFDQGLGQRVWPGYKFSSDPTIITYKETGHIYAFNLDSKDSRWSSVVIAGKSAQYSAVDFWGFSQFSLFPTLPIEGKSAYLFQGDFSFVATNPTFSAVVFVHERFHKYQISNFTDFFNSNGKFYKGHLDQNNVDLIFLENAALLKYLESHNLEMLKYFLAINQMRTNSLDNDSKKWELWQQKIEGTAEYVQTRTLQFYPLQGLDALQVLTKRANTYFVADETGIDNIIKWRHYSVGAILSFALQDLGIPNWMSDLEKTGKNQTEILKSYFKLSDKIIKELVEKAKTDLNFADIRSKTSSMLSAYIENIRILTEQFNKEVGVEIILEFSKMTCSGGGDSEKTIYLSDGSTLSIGGNYATMCDNSKILFSYKNAAIVFKTPDGGVKLKDSDPASIVILDGNSLLLSDLAEKCEPQVMFNKIHWTDKMVALEALKAGTISCENHKLTFMFN